MTPDAGQLPAFRDRAAYLDQIGSLLWPEAARVRPSDGGSPAGARRAGRGLIAIPAAGRPRIIVPSAPRAAAAAVRRYGEPGSARMRAATRALSVLLRAGTGGVLGDRLWTDYAGAPATEQEDAASIGSYLRQQLGSDLCISMHLGAARANRKPVLQLLTAAGGPVGFAKIGVNVLTRDLVRAERDALIALGNLSLTGLSVPAVLHAGCWRGLDVLVISPLPVWRSRVPFPASRLAAAMLELATAAGISKEPLAGGAYWPGLQDRLGAATDTPDRQALGTVLTELAGRAGREVLPFGCWHGDWTPWNMASVKDGLLVWDWERFAAGVPVGFDAVHYWLQARVVSVQTDPGAAATACVREAPALLDPFGLGPGQARLTALTYLAELAVRYLADRQAEAGARLGSPGTWLIPALRSEVADL